MGGHLPFGDEYKIADARRLERMEAKEKVTEARRLERMEAMEQQRARDMMVIWPTPCPTCFAEVGERCMTRTGKRYGGRHVGRM